MRESAELNETSISTAEAFGPDLPPGGLYIGTALRQRIDLIEHLLEFGHQIILLCGAAASGKSTLLRSLAVDAGSRWHCVDVRGGPALGPRALLETVAEAAGIGVEAGWEDAELLERLRQRAAQMERSGKLLVLLLDDADELSPEALATLLALTRHDPAGTEPRVLMTADQEHGGLLASLQRDDPNRGLVHVIEIPPLNDAQIEAFLAQRASAVGLALEDCLDADALATVAAEGAGNPGKLLALARQAASGQLAGRSGSAGGSLLAQFGQLGTMLTRRAVLVGVGALGVFVLGALFWLGRPVPPPIPGEEEARPAAAEGAHEIAGAAADTGRKQFEISLPAATDATTGQAAASTEATSPLESPAHAGATTPPSAASALPAEASVPQAPSAPGMDAGGAPGDALPEDSDTQALAPPPSSIAGAVGAAGLAAAAGATKAEPAPAPSAAPREPAKQPSKTATSKTREASRKPPPQPASRRVTSDNQAKAERPGRTPTSPSPRPRSSATANGAPAPLQAGYTLQLVGVKERAAASEFIRKHQLGKAARIIESRRNGQAWFTVAYGNYATRAAANAAASALPASVRRATTPWVRAVNGRSKPKK